jgi:hypothetical protein
MTFVCSLLTMAFLLRAPAALHAADSAKSPFAPHPAAAALDQLFSPSNPAPKDFKPTGLTRRDYLTLIAGDVDFFKKFQDAKTGAIIDPYRKQETQYATPAFAVAAGILVTEAKRDDLLDPATRALTCSIDALLAHHPADGHADFYIPLIMHAHRLLKDAAPKNVVQHWDDQLRRIDPTNAYRAELRLMNWNVVSTCGELLRRHDALVAPAMLDAQQKYIEQCLAGHQDKLTPFGMYEDPNAPLAYDEFARLWLDDMMADGAYDDGALAPKLHEFLKLGGLSTLILLSPSGEWASGGRSAFHNWNEAETALICEINATKWQRANRPDVAGAFKRAAHLAYQSMLRWQRPSGELWIVKNRADPSERFGYEAYSYHSQYNLLPMAMLAMAYTHADDQIAERPTPAETGGYVFDVRPTFHKIAAAAGGYYILIDTNADPHYNATGLQRVHRAGVAFPPLSDTTAAERAYGPSNAPKIAMTPGIQWKDADDKWHSLADSAVKDVSLRVNHTSPDDVTFEVDYALKDDRHVIEQCALSSDGVDVTDRLTGDSPPAAMRLRLPALVNDGASDTTVETAGDSAQILNRGSRLTYKVLASGAAVALKLDGPRIPSHIGYQQAMTAELPATASSQPVEIHISLSQDSSSASK